MNLHEEVLLLLFVLNYFFNAVVFLLLLLVDGCCVIFVSMILRLDIADKSNSISWLDVIDMFYCCNYIVCACCYYLFDNDVFGCIYILVIGCYLILVSLLFSLYISLVNLYFNTLICLDYVVDIHTIPDDNINNNFIITITLILF